MISLYFSLIILPFSYLSYHFDKSWRVFKCCLVVVVKMLANRKYLISPNDKNMSLNEFKEQFGDPLNKTLLTLLVAKLEDSTDKLFVFFCEDDKVGVKPIRAYLEHMKNEGVKRAVLVCSKEISPIAKQALNEMKPMYFVEYFKEEELMIDITEHELVPKHEVLSDDEKQTLLKQYKLKDTQLPRMRPEDPVARYFGLVRGQVVKIIRASETAGRYVTYRIVL